MSTAEERFIQWALRDGERQRKLLSVPRVGDLPRVVATPRLQDASVACAVWNPGGTGRLRLAYPVPARVHPPLRPGALEFHDTYLVLDDVPLLHWRENGCPSCEQLARAAADRPSDVCLATSGLHALTRDSLANDPAACVPWLTWLFTLLPVGFYLVTLKDYDPIVARLSDKATCMDESLATGLPAPFTALTRFDERASRGRVPRRLVPTQQLGIVRPGSVARARVLHRTHPGIALHLHEGAAALLDGHHRALAAAEADVAFACITVIPGGVAFPPQETGASCSAWARGAPEVVFRPARVALPLNDVPGELHEWILACALAACSSRRWEWDKKVVERWEADFEVAGG